MDERVIPAIILALNFLSMIGLLFFKFFIDVSSVLMIASWLSLVLVAYWVYENDQRVEFLEKHVWKKIERLEQDLKLAHRSLAEINERLESK